MTIKQFLVSVFMVLILGLMLPLRSGPRTALFLTLIVVGMLTFIGGGVHYAASLMQ